jgi:hypothetical protein
MLIRIVSSLAILVSMFQVGTAQIPVPPVPTNIQASPSSNAPSVFKIPVYVPRDYPTIQQAIDAANSSSLILVEPGTYLENIDFKGKPVKVKSVDGPKWTVIDGNQSSSVIVCNSGEDNKTILTGFTITNGIGLSSGSVRNGAGIFCEKANPIINGNIICSNLIQDGNGAGIYCNDASPTIINNVIIDNYIKNGNGAGLYIENTSISIVDNLVTQNTVEVGDGGGVYCVNATIQIRKCTIEDNSTMNGSGGGLYLENAVSDVSRIVFRGNQSISGGGMSCSGSSPLIVNCMFIENTANIGGGLFVSAGSSPILTNNTLFKNQASATGGGIECGSEHVEITNTIIWDNTAASNAQIGGVNVDAEYSDIQGGWPGTGNIDDDPIFIDPTDGDCHVFYQSPCRDGGTNNVSSFPVEDFEGDPRDRSGASIGADGYFLHAYILDFPVKVGKMTTVYVVGEPGTSGTFYFSGFYYCYFAWPFALYIPVTLHQDAIQMPLAFNSTGFTSYTLAIPNNPILDYNIFFAWAKVGNIQSKYAIGFIKL